LKPLTANQFEALRAIEEYVEANGFSPTLRELTALLGLKSLHGTKVRLNLLSESGVVSFIPQKSRTIRVLVPSTAFVMSGNVYVRNAEANRPDTPL